MFYYFDKNTHDTYVLRIGPQRGQIRSRSLTVYLSTTRQCGRRHTFINRTREEQIAASEKVGYEGSKRRHDGCMETRWRHRAKCKFRENVDAIDGCQLPQSEDDVEVVGRGFKNNHLELREALVGLVVGTRVS